MVYIVYMFPKPALTCVDAEAFHTAHLAGAPDLIHICPDEMMAQMQQQNTVALVDGISAFRKGMLWSGEKPRAYSHLFSCPMDEACPDHLDHWEVSDGLYRVTEW